MRLLLFPFIAALACGARAQTRPDCPTRPQTLAAMRGCYRPLLVFAPSVGDRRLAAQRTAVDQAADDMMDRDVLLVPMVEAGASFEPPLDAPYSVLGVHEMAAARRRYGVAPGKFTVVLLGEDGSEKLRSDKPVMAEELNSLIDRMPTRKLEMQQPHTN